MNPELRQTLNTISRNFETANETAQENIYTFTQLVIDPCFNGVKSCLVDCTGSCFPSRDERLRRRRAKSRGGADLHFDFYDDWDEDDTTYTGNNWGNDELDSLLAGRGSRNGQPGRQRAMSYGARNRRKPQTQGEEDPNIIPSSSYLGFLERFRWRLGSRGVRYKPSAADLQEHPGRLHEDGPENEPLIEDDNEDQEDFPSNYRKGHARNRSDTQASRSTTNSLSSRGDLIMGDEEDDAVPIDDEFAVMLSKQSTRDSNRRPGASRRTSRTVSGRSSKSAQSRKSNSSRDLEPIASSPVMDRSEITAPSMAELRLEEESLKHEEEFKIAQKRYAASQLAEAKGLNRGSATAEPKEAESHPQTPSTQTQTHLQADDLEEDDPIERPTLASPHSGHTGYHADSETEPFPSLPTSPLREDREFHPPP